MPEVTLDVIADDGSMPTQLDALARQLAFDIRALRMFSVQGVAAPTSSDGKSTTANQIGTLVVSGVFSATAIRALRDVIVAYLDRTKARAVTVRVGSTEVTLTGASASDLSEIARQLTSTVEGGPAEL
ncbi:MAG: hypothetical protein AUI14_04495 [Actinobacteria bacterium 13_2_20CM_2_71_6]|nr:MAG: hypothetical protein AUI14_04495 [Actinobacteria bacterium 13_2_20CM_2_71_6]